MWFSTPNFSFYALRLTFMPRFAMPAAMARPKKGEELGATSYVGARIPDSLRAEMDEIARRNGRDLAKEVREAFEAHVKRSKRK
jgi:hypothetical protein